MLLKPLVALHICQFTVYHTACVFERSRKSIMSKLKLAVEVISAHNLMPKDGQGSSSPYIEVAVESPYFLKIIIIEAVQSSNFKFGFASTLS